MQSNFTIYICSKCKIIISTSIHVVQEMKELGMIKFREANAGKMKTLQTSVSSFDKFCTYQSLICFGCSEAIGKFYKAVTPQLANCFDYYCIVKEKLARFERIEDGKVSEKSTPTFTNCMNEDVKELAKESLSNEISLYDPLTHLNLTDPYDEYKFIRRTIKLAEQAESMFTKGLLKLENRVDTVEKKAKQVRKLCKHITNSLELI